MNTYKYSSNFPLVYWYNNKLIKHISVSLLDKNDEEYFLEMDMNYEMIKEPVPTNEKFKCTVPILAYKKIGTENRLSIIGYKIAYGKDFDIDYDKKFHDKRCDCLTCKIMRYCLKD
jgi:hypothetical protein